jgi:hypothetical protein
MTEWRVRRRRGSAQPRLLPGRRLRQRRPRQLRDAQAHHGRPLRQRVRALDDEGREGRRGPYRHCDDGFGAPGSAEYSLVKGKSYTFKLRWIATKLGAYPDYDWQCLINDLASAGARPALYGTGAVVIEDPDGLLTGERHGDDDNLTLGKEGKIHVPKVELVPYTDGGILPLSDYETWKPSIDGDALLFEARVIPSTLVGYFDFYIDESTAYPGYCMNAPWPVPQGGARHSAAWSDLRFQNPQPSASGCRVTVSGDQADIAHDNESVPMQRNRVAVISDDYAAWGKLRCVARIRTMNSDTWVTNIVAVNPATGLPHIVVPKDMNGNRIADAETAHDTGDPGDDDDSRDGVGALNFLGDALTRFEEYRGFMMLKENSAETEHIRTDPGKQDYFYWNQNSNELKVDLFKSQSRLLTHAVAEDGRAAGSFILNFAWDESADSALGITTKRQIAPSLIIDNTISERGEYWEVDRTIRINRDHIWNNAESISGVSAAQQMEQVVAHETGHSCWLPHHGSNGYYAGLKGPACLMRVFNLTYEPCFCTYATPSPEGGNAETGDPEAFGLDGWDCEDGCGDCLHRIRVNPVRHFPLEE